MGHELSYTNLPDPWLRRIMRRWKLWVLVLVVMTSVWWGGPVYRWGHTRYLIWKLKNREIPAGQLLAHFDPESGSSGVLLTETSVREWTLLRERLGLSSAGKRVPVFIHGRNTPDGNEWLVVVEFDASWVGYNREFGSSGAWWEAYYITCIRAGRFWKRPRVLEAHGRFHFPVRLGGTGAKFLSSMVDGNDPTHVTLNVEVNGTLKPVELWMRPDVGLVQFEEGGGITGTMLYDR